MKAKLNKLYLLIKREYWENKNAFLKAPMVLSVIILFIAFCSFSLFIYHSTEIISATQNHPANQSELPIRFVDNLLYVIASPLMLVLWLVVFNYFLGSLINDRKDRSILFWLSLPITHTESIIAKVIAGIIIAPFVSWVCIMVTELISLVLLTIVALILHIGDIGQLWPLGSILFTWGKMLITFYWQGLWLFPLFGFCMLASAYAKRSPFLVAVLPVILLVIIEGMFLRSAYLSEAISLCFSHALAAWGSLFESSDYVLQIAPLADVFQYGDFGGHLLLGLVFGIFFMTIAGLLRFFCYRFDQI